MEFYTRYLIRKEKYWKWAEKGRGGCSAILITFILQKTVSVRMLNRIITLYIRKTHMRSALWPKKSKRLLKNSYKKIIKFSILYAVVMRKREIKNTSQEKWLLYRIIKLNKTRFFQFRKFIIGLIAWNTLILDFLTHNRQKVKLIKQ